MTLRPFVQRAISGLCALLALGLLLVLPAFSGKPPQRRSEGNFIDRTGGRHGWNVNGAHALIWEGKPYLPVGALLKLRSWARDASTEDWQSDQDAIRQLKAAGATDICITPARGGLTAIKPETIQRTLDFLDTNGFTYGIRVQDGPRQPLIGYEVRPGAYRQEVPEVGGTLRFPVEGAASALAFVVGESTREIAAVRAANLVGDDARLNFSIGNPESKQIVFLVPERIFPVGSPIAMPDLWNGFDEYRDELITHLAQVKFGPGFRFFADPLPAGMTITPEFQRVLPSGPGFAAEWQVWLARKYKTIEALQSAWAMTSREIDDFPVAASLMPLWNGGKGVEVFYRRSNGKQYGVDTRRTQFWTDLSAFKTDSVREYQNSLATALKKSVGEVPVVYSAEAGSSLYAKLPTERGYDGLAMATPGVGQQRVLAGATGIYAQSFECSKTLWLPAFVRATEQDSFAQAGNLTRDLDAMRDIGARAFFVETTPELLRGAGVAANIGAYASEMGKIAETLANEAPSVIFYPRTMENVQTRQLASGVWWLPTDRPYTPLDFGKLGRGYYFNDEMSDGTYYLWNPLGTSNVRFKVPRAANIKNAPPITVGNGPPGVVRKGILTLAIGPDPIRLGNYPALPMPMDAFENLYKEGKELAAQARKLGRADAGRADQSLTFAKAKYKQDDPWPAYKEMQQTLQGLRQGLRRYIWLEAEQADRHTFDEASPQIGASAGYILSVGKRARAGGATVYFQKVFANEKAIFQVWVAATPGARISVRADSQPLDELATARGIGEPFADGKLIWVNYGSTELSTGSHTLEIRTENEAILDAILLTPVDFVPNGTVPPPVL